VPPPCRGRATAASRRAGAHASNELVQPTKDRIEAEQAANGSGPRRLELLCRQPDRPSDPPVTASDRRPSQVEVTRLLRSHRALLQLVNEPVPARRRVSWIACRRFTLAYARRVVDELRRSYEMRLAVREYDDDDEANGAAVGRFATALPPTQSTAWSLLLILAALAVASALVAGFGDITGERTTFNEVSKFASLNPGDFHDAADALLHSSFSVGWDLLGAVTLSTYAVLRPFVPGFRLSLLARGAPGAHKPRRTDLVVLGRAQELTVHRHEAAVLESLGVRPPAGVRFDLIVKAVIALFWLELGIDAIAVPADRDIALGVVAAFLAAARLAWLHRTWRTERATRPTVLIRPELPARPR
jgi:hypothetical protein